MPSWEKAKEDFLEVLGLGLIRELSQVEREESSFLTRSSRTEIGTVGAKN
jgi:hypothetical protein